MTAAPELTIALPIRDGAALLEETLLEVDAFVSGFEGGAEVIAVDDGSRDATAAILRRFATHHPYLRVLRHRENRGKGAALKTAAGASRGEFLLTLDADATYSMAAVRDCLAALRAGHDAAIGNRRDPRTRFVLHPSHFPYIGLRHAVGWLFGRLARALAGIRVADSQCGFKCYRGSVARRLFPQVDSLGFAFDVEVLALLELQGHGIVEVPVVYFDRDQPSSVRLVRDGLRMFGRLLAVRAKLRRLRRSGPFADAKRDDYQDRARREGHPVQRFWHARKWDLVERRVRLSPGCRVLDVGSGSSEIPARASRREAFTCAADARVGPLAFLRARQRAEAAGPLVFAAADVHDLPFRDGSFDAITALELIEHLPRERAARYLGELRRTLAPGGRLLVTTPNYRSLWPVLEWVIDRAGGAAEMGGKQHISRFHAQSLRRALAESGLRAVEIGSVYHLSPFLAPVAPGLAERLFAWELRRGGTLGPVLYAVAEAVPR